MTIWQEIGESIYAPHFYQTLRARPFSSSLAYFFKVAVILSVFLTVLFSFELIPAVHAFLVELSPSILSQVPDSFLLTVRDGHLVSNAHEPFFISFPQGPLSDALSLKNLFVIDTQSPVSPELFRGYQTFLLLTRDSAVTGNDHDQNIRLESLATLENATVTKPVIASMLARAQPYLLWVIPLLLLGTFGGFLFYFSLKLVYLLLAALLIAIVARVRKVPVGYLGAYQIGLHAITLGLAIDAALLVFVPRGVPFAVTLSLLFVAWLNL